MRGCVTDKREVEYSGWLLSLVGQIGPTLLESDPFEVEKNLCVLLVECVSRVC